MQMLVLTASEAEAVRGRENIGTEAQPQWVGLDPIMLADGATYVLPVGVSSGIPATALILASAPRRDVALAEFPATPED